MRSVNAKAVDPFCIALVPDKATIFGFRECRRQRERGRLYCWQHGPLADDEQDRGEVPQASPQEAGR